MSNELIKTTVFPKSELGAAVVSDGCRSYYKISLIDDLIDRYEESVCEEIYSLRVKMAEQEAKINAYENIIAKSNFKMAIEEKTYSNKKSRDYGTDGCRSV